MVNDAIPFFEDGEEITCTATTAVIGKRFVAISGDLQADGTVSVAPAGDNARAFGVAMWDAAVGKRVTVKTIESGHVMPVTVTGAAVAAGVALASAAAGLGRAAVAGERAMGVVVTGVAANGDAMVKLGRQVG
jgi:hypothetical protein